MHSYSISGNTNTHTYCPKQGLTSSISCVNSSLLRNGGFQSCLISLDSDCAAISVYEHKHFLVTSFPSICMFQLIRDYATFKKFWVEKIFFFFLKNLFSPFIQWKIQLNSNIAKYYYNLKYVFYVNIL